MFFLAESAAMHDLLTADEISFQHEVADLVRARVAPFAEKADREERLPSDSWSALAEAGLLGVAIPREFGGLGRSLMHMAIALEEVSTRCPSTALSYGAHSILCAYNLFSHGNDLLRRAFLPELCSGARGGAFAITEPGAGSDATGLATRARRDGDAYLLNGGKTFITNGPFADVVLVYARTSAENERRALSALMVEASLPGFSVSRNLKKLGFRGSPTSELMFTDCRVPADRMLGREGDGIAIMMASLDVERALLSAIPLGMARRCLDLMRPVVRGERRTQEAESAVADALVGIEALRGLLTRAVRCLDRTERATVPASCAKLYGSEMIMQVASACVDVTVGTAAQPEAERLFRDAKLIAIGAGTSQVQKLILARSLLDGEPAREHAHAGV